MKLEEILTGIAVTALIGGVAYITAKYGNATGYTPDISYESDEPSIVPVYWSNLTTKRGAIAAIAKSSLWSSDKLESIINLAAK